MPDDETSNPPEYDPSSMSWEGTSKYGPEIAQHEHRRWATFLAQIASSTGDAGVLGNFLPPDLQQDVERLTGQLASEKEWSAALEEEVQQLEQKITNLNKELTWRDLEIGPESPLRPFYLN